MTKTTTRNSIAPADSIRSLTQLFNRYNARDISVVRIHGTQGVGA